MLVYYEELKKNYYKYHRNYLLIDGITEDLFDGYMSTSPIKISTNKKITDGMTYGFSVGDMLY
jgi:hypothetical protein